MLQNQSRTLYPQLQMVYCQEVSGTCPISSPLEFPRCLDAGGLAEMRKRNLKEAIQLRLETELTEIFRPDPQAETAELVLA